MQVKINKSSLYAPIRYEATRPYALRLGQAFLAAHARGEQARLAFIQRPLWSSCSRLLPRWAEKTGLGPCKQSC